MKIEIRDIKKSFGDKEVLKGVSFEAESGKAFGLLGRNGAGKTTSIRIIMGVFYSDSGSILVDGKPIEREKLRIGYLPEERGLYPKKSISEQLVYFGMLRGLSKKDARLAASEWIDKMNLGEYKDKKLETLSKGNQQKIQLAVTLMCNPELIILDEPFSGLDPVNAKLLKDIIKEMIEGGAAVIFSSHQMNHIEEFCEDIAILNQGRVAISGNIREIKRSYPRNTIDISSTENKKLSAFILKKMAGDIEEVSEDEKSGILTVKLRSPDIKNKLIREISDEGLDIDSFMVREPSLSDIFVEYAEGGI